MGWRVVRHLVRAGSDCRIDLGEVFQAGPGQVGGEGGFGFTPGLVQRAHTSPVASTSEQAFVGSNRPFDDLDKVEQEDLGWRPAQRIASGGTSGGVEGSVADQGCEDLAHEVAGQVHAGGDLTVGTHRWMMAGDVEHRSDRIIALVGETHPHS